MDENQRQIGLKAHRIIKKHLQEIKDDFKKLGIELEDFITVNGSFSWKFIKNKEANSYIRYF